MSNQSLLYIALILSIFAACGVAFALWQMNSFKRLKKTFFAGHAGVDLEDVILKHDHELVATKEELLVLQNHLAELKENFQFVVQKIGIVRFNPFSDGGGNFSFTLALLDAQNNGVVLTSMHGREQNRIYAKQIFGNKSDAPLTEEEAEAIKIANTKNQMPTGELKSKHKTA